jgi:LAO/AO transport system ATPase
MLDELFSRFAQKDRLALSRLLTLAALPERAEAIRKGIPRTENRAKVVAITGNSGVGKSTLIGRLIEVLRRRQKTVAVLACDPESSLTGGALLGDRVRMPSLPDDAGVFIRSLAAASGQQAIARHLDVMRGLLEAFGFDIILIETVGAGQGDTAVRDAADVVVLLLQPEAGDDLQWEKAGILEVADVVVIHKSDLQKSAQVEAQVRGLLNLPGCREVPIVRASAAKNEGIEELWDVIESLPVRDANSRDGQALLRLAQMRLAERFAERREAMGPLIKRWTENQMDESAAADELLKVLAKG